MSRSGIQLQQVERVAVAVIQGHARMTDLTKVVPEWCGRVWNVVRAQQAKAGRNIAIYWDDTIRLEVGVELLGPFVEQNGVVCSATPRGTVASAIHMGPYGQLAATHHAIRDWCQANNYRLAGPNWEVYGHWRAEWDADPSQIRTDVFYLVDRAGTK